MSQLIVQALPVEAAAAQLAEIGAAISQANAVAAGPTIAVAAAAADEVSASLAALFNTYAQQAHALLKQAAALQAEFARNLATAARSYLQAEAAGVAALWPQESLGTGAGSGIGAVSSLLQAPPKPSVALVMGGTGDPTPLKAYRDAVTSLFIHPNQPGAVPQTLFTPEQLYPLTGVRSLPFDTSVQQGVAILHQAIMSQLNAGNHVTVFGYSQSAEIASLEMRHLAAMGASAPSTADLDFVLIGNPMNPNGGLLQRFVGLSFPSMGLTFVGATPDNVYPTTVYTREYDGLADFPRYPLNVVSDLNAFLGIGYVHFGYPHLTSEEVNSAITLSTDGPTVTTYKMILTENLPLLEPLRAIPVIGKPLAELMQPNLAAIVNLGYGDPAHGYSTTAANIPTPFGLFPAVDPSAVLNAFAAGTQQGVHDFVAALPEAFGELQALPATLAALVQLPNLVIPTLPETANTIASIVSTDYAVLLPTADIVTAATTSLPAYDFTLFMSGLQRGSLVNAIGDPIAANVAMLTMAGFMEIAVVGEAAVFNVLDIERLLT